MESLGEADVISLLNGFMGGETLESAVNAALLSAKESGTFDGADGQPGEKGEKGDTPVKGVDYCTDADKVELVEAVLAALPDASEEVF